MKNISHFAIKGIVLLVVFGLTAAFATYGFIGLVSRIEQSVIIPDIVGKDGVEALVILSNLGLNAKVASMEFNNHFSKHKVLLQDPKPGEEIKKGRTVRLILSKGPKTVLLRDLIAKKLQNAQLALDQMGLCMGGVSRVFSEKIALGSIVAQFPSPGRAVQEGTCVDLLISKGKRPLAFRMPHLEGLVLDEAVSRMDRLSLSLEILKFEKGSGNKKDEVLEQFPAPGAKVTDSTPIRLRVRGEPEQEHSVEISGLSSLGLFEFKVEPGYLKRHIRVEMTGFGTTLLLTDDFISPGQTLRYLVPRNKNVLITVYDDGDPIVTQTF